MPRAQPESPSSEIEAVRTNERVLGVMLVLHGLAHLTGFILSWRIFAPRGFEYDDVWPAAATGPGRAVGVVWLVVAVAIVVTGVRLVDRSIISPAQLAVPLIASVVLCAMSSPPALPGAVISGGLLIAMAVVQLRRSGSQGR